MNFLNSEKNILIIVKYGATASILLFSLIITLIFINEKKEELNREITTLKSNYLKENKEIIKNEVDKTIVLINDEIKKSENILKEFLKKKVYEAHRVATILYNEEKNNSLNGHIHTEEHIFNTIKHALRGMSYEDNRGYFFIDDINGKKLLQPFNEEFEGEKLLDFEDVHGYKFVQKIVQTIKNKTEDYDEYYWYKPNDKTKIYKKMSFYKYFEPFNVAIGAGEYLVDFEERQKLKVLEWIRKIKHNENGYIFIYDKKGLCLSHIKEECIGQNRIEVQDKEGNYIIKNLLSFTKEKKEGYYRYLSSFSDNFDSPEKISYVKLFDKWEWVIGTGFYLSKLKNEIKVKEERLIANSELVINKILTISIIITILMIAISFYISNTIARKFNTYKKNIDKEIKNTIKKEKLLAQQSKMAVMGEMIGNIAHQWKQPLSLISMSNSLVKINRETEGFNTEEEINEALENIDNSVVYLSSTVDDFRNFFSANKEKTFFSIETIFDKTFKLINSEFKNSNIEIVKNIQDVKISGYQNELLQVLINIIKNAKDEFIRKEENSKKQFLFIDVYEENNNAVIKIKDSSGGIPNEIFENIFKAYFSTKRDSGGTGIGLYMSRQIIKSMDGEINVSNVEYEFEDEKYIGAEFTIKLPLNI